jgi:hypothetical protein
MAARDRKPHSNLMVAQVCLVSHVARISSRTPQNLKAKVKKPQGHPAGLEAQRRARKAGCFSRTIDRLKAHLDKDVGAVAKPWRGLRKKNAQGTVPSPSMTSLEKD